MTKIPAQTQYNGFMYKLVEAGKTAAIYAQIDEESPFEIEGIRGCVAFEVWTIGTFFRVPKDEAFGVTAWTYKTLGDARKRMAQ